MVQFLWQPKCTWKLIHNKKYQLAAVPDLNAWQMFLELLDLYQCLQTTNNNNPFNDTLSQMIWYQKKCLQSRDKVANWSTDMPLYCMSTVTFYTIIWCFKDGLGSGKCTNTVFFFFLICLQPFFTPNLKLTCCVKSIPLQTAVLLTSNFTERDLDL